MNQVTQLKHQYQAFYDLQGVPGIPDFESLQANQDNFELKLASFGTPLKVLLKNCYGKFSQNTVFKLVIRILVTLKQIHFENLILGCIGIDNIHISTHDGSNITYFTKFGTGTSNLFTSCNFDCENQIHFRDDLESLSYLAIYLLKGTLPWSNENGIDEFDFDDINEIKLTKCTQIPKLLCYGLPIELLLYSKYVQILTPSCVPDYDKLISLFQDNLAAQNLTDENFIYDWQLEDSSDLDHLSPACGVPSEVNSSFDPMMARVVEYQAEQFKKDKISMFSKRSFEIECDGDQSDSEKISRMKYKQMFRNKKGNMAKSCPFKLISCPKNETPTPPEAGQKAPSDLKIPCLKRGRSSIFTKETLEIRDHQFTRPKSFNRQRANTGNIEVTDLVNKSNNQNVRLDAQNLKINDQDGKCPVKMSKEKYIELKRNKFMRKRNTEELFDYIEEDVEPRLVPNFDCQEGSLLFKQKLPKPAHT